MRGLSGRGHCPLAHKVSPLLCPFTSSELSRALRVLFPIPPDAGGLPRFRAANFSTQKLIAELADL
jgi:hypothetical protein